MAHAWWLATGWSFRAAASIVPRSRHRPVASTDGSLTENVNKTGVRLWAECWPPITIPSWERNDQPA
jgi:hypothetical protein